MKLTKRQRKQLVRIIISALLLAAGIILGAVGLKYVPLALLAAAYIVAGHGVLIKAAKGILSAQLLDENFLMSVASIGAMVLGEYSEAVAVMLFYQVGVLFENIAVARSRKSISSLMDMRADRAAVIRCGEMVTVSPEEVEVGEIIVVKPGEKLPLDGVVTEGTTTLNTAALTGESLPRCVSVGDEVLSGTVNNEGMIWVRVTKPAHESTVSRILDLVENSAAKKSRHEAFITRFARYYTPIVVCLALVLATVPSLITGEWSAWVYRGLNFLVISCPCALVISVPLAYFGGIGAASRRGILVKGGNCLEALAKCENVVFDKTGTLTEGRFKVTQVYPIDMSEDALLRIAAKAESASSHPIARSVVEAYGGVPDTSDVTDVTETAGMGVTCKIDGVTTAVGSEKLISSLGGHVLFGESDGTTTLFVLYRGKLAGMIAVEDAPKSTAGDAISELRREGVKKCVMLTGDSSSSAKRVADELSLDSYYACLLPGDKVTLLEGFLPSGTTVFVGDGINDAPVLSRADVGIAMGGIGSDAAIEAADVVIMDDDPRRLAEAVRIARKTGRIAVENTVFALSVKAAVMVLGVFGFANMWLAVFADVGVSVLAIINSMRMQR